MFESLDLLIRKDRSYGVAGPCPESLISEVEAILGFRFPSDVRTFVQRYGYVFGPVGSISILNGSAKNLSDQGATAFAKTLEKRKEAKLPKSFLVMDDDDYPSICVDTASGSRVILFYDLIVPPKIEVASASFEAWIDEWVSSRLEDLQ